MLFKKKIDCKYVNKDDEILYFTVYCLFYVAKAVQFSVTHIDTVYMNKNDPRI